MQIIKLWLLFGLIFNYFSYAKKFDNECKKKLDAYIQKTKQLWKVPGLSVVVVKDGQVSFLNNYGQRSIKTKLPITNLTKFAVASVSKAFSATLAVKLSQKGLLNLKDPVISYVSDFKMHDDEATKKLTLFDVLTHHIGFKSFTADSLFLLGFSRDEFKKTIAKIPLKYTVGTHYGYSNYGYVLLGEILENACKEPFSVILQREILDPLHMNHTLISVPEDSFLDKILIFFNLKEPQNLAIPHDLDDNGDVRDIGFNPQMFKQFQSSAGILISPEDMAKWLLFHLNGNKAVLDPSHFQMMHSVQRKITINNENFDYFFHKSRFDKDRDFGMSAGFFINQYGASLDKKIEIHQVVGANSGNRAIIVLAPSLNIGIAVMCNLGSLVNYAPESIVNFLLDELMDVHDTDWAQFFKNHFDKNIKDHQKYKQSERLSNPMMMSYKPSDLVGRYHHEWLGDIDVYIKHDQLYFKFRGKEAALRYWNGNEFSYKGSSLGKAFHDRTLKYMSFGQLKSNGRMVLQTSQFSEIDGIFSKAG
jgi:CubicO group peptidase (beta-lactamase class C family)